MTASYMKIKALIISGSMGSGKTTLMAEASDILSARGIAHAAIDLDALGVVHVPGTASDDLMHLNLQSVWTNYTAAGVDKLVLAYAVESRRELDRLQQTLSAAEIIVCRLKARLETMEQRVRSREPGFLQSKFVARVAELEELLDHADVEDFCISNDDGSVTEVAHEILVRAGWIGRSS